MKAKVKAFSRMGAAQKRIAICEDILKQIKAAQYNIQQGTWLDVEGVDVPQPTLPSVDDESKRVQNVLLGSKHTIVVETKPATCTCCAVGAACASAIRLFNQDVLSEGYAGGYELGGYNEGMEILEKYFPKAQVDLMEAAFEQRTEEHHTDAKESAIDAAIEFGNKHYDDTERLQAICKNIIKNKGTFKP